MTKSKNEKNKQENSEYKMFKGKGSKHKPPTISILKIGVVIFNTTTLKTYFDSIKKINFMYNEKKNSIGFMPVKEEHEGAYSLIRTWKKKEKDHCTNSSGVISCRAFLKSINYDYTETKKFDIDFNEKEGMCEIFLDKPVQD